MRRGSGPAHAPACRLSTTRALTTGDGITDDGTAGAPAWREPETGAESGRGFQLVNEIATRWGILRDQAGTCCWFDLGDQEKP
jgi:hypothetical protein